MQWIARAETPEDIEAIRWVNPGAFPTPAEADLVDALRRDESWIPGLSIVSGTAADPVVGYALLTRCRIGDDPALALAPCSVLPEFQRQGAGRAAIEAALDAARAMGEQVAVVLGHPTYYPRFGFVTASRWGITAPIDVRDDALMVLSLNGAPIPAGMIAWAPPFGI